jgi:hypothetical protein
MISLHGFRNLGVFTAGRVTLIAESRSDARSLITALTKALQASHVPVVRTRVKRLDLDAVSLGYDRSTGWIQTKLFFGQNDNGEVYLNLNTKTGLGEFSLKDPDYGNYVVTRLARVL